jgi:hypothetical protein
VLSTGNDVVGFIHIPQHQGSLWADVHFHGCPIGHDHSWDLGPLPAPQIDALDAPGGTELDLLPIRRVTRVEEEVVVDHDAVRAGLLSSGGDERVRWGRVNQRWSGGRAVSCAPRCEDACGAHRI